MTPKQIVNAAAAVTAFVAIVLAGMLFSAPPVRAQFGAGAGAGAGFGSGAGGPVDTNSIQSRAQLGLQIAPVKLNYDRFDSNETTLVGYGSYIVNGQADCNGCHSSPDLGGEFVSPSGMPFFLTPPKIKTKVNPAGYLGGGTDFGEYPGPGPWGAGPFPHIVTRNLTPDISGRPEGGNTLQQFITIMRNGKDFDGIHPTCGPAGLDGTCIPAPFDGSLLQIMPWPNFANMSDYDLQAIYEYLKAIPCISHRGSPGLPANIYQVCPGETPLPQPPAD